MFVQLWWQVAQLAAPLLRPLSVFPRNAFYRKEGGNVLASTQPLALGAVFLPLPI